MVCRTWCFCGGFVVDCVVKRGQFVVGFRAGKMGHSLRIYFLRGFVLFDVSCRDSGMGSVLGAIGVSKLTNGVGRAKTKCGDPSPFDYAQGQDDDFKSKSGVHFEFSLVDECYLSEDL
jgi:hypothetical protein